MWKWKCSSLSCDQLFATPTDCSPPGSSVHGIFQARILDWVAISFSKIFFIPILLRYDWHAYWLSCVWLFVTPWTVACQAPLSMGFSRQEYWVGYHTLLQWIFLAEGWNLCHLHLLHWEAGSLSLAPPRKPCATPPLFSTTLLPFASAVQTLIWEIFTFPGGSEVKASAWNVGHPGSIPGWGRSPGEGKWQPTPGLLPGESRGGRSLVGYSPWGRKVLDTTERLHSLHFTSLLFTLHSYPFQTSPRVMRFPILKAKSITWHQRRGTWTV